MSLSLVFVLIVAGCAVTQANGSLRFTGSAYNILTGNPDGIQLGTHHGGTDPGILATRKVLKVSTTDGSIVSTPREACRTSENVYMNLYTYQKKLEYEINVSGSVGFKSVNFGASAGSTRYQIELAQSKGFTTTDSFASVICKLPTTYDKQKYMEYLDMWGTHVITKVDLGTKDIARNKTSSTDVLNFAESSTSVSVSMEASTPKVSASLSVDVSHLQSDKNFKSVFKTSLTHYVIGTNTLPEPIQLSLHEVTTFLEARFWSNLNDLVSRSICQSGFNVADIRTNMIQALKDYPAYLKVKNPDPNSLIKIPLVWPEGTYGLPMPTLACSTEGSGITQTSACPTGQWYTGWRYHDTEWPSAVLSVVKKFKCLEGLFDPNVKWFFCMKHESTGNFRLKWPKGSYCIFKKGACPTGLTYGSTFIDDQNDFNSNSRGGYLPDGKYDYNTEYHFCCRNDGYTTSPIYLPTEKPFFLIAKTVHCQQVYGMKVTPSVVFFDCDNLSVWRHTYYSKGNFPYDFGLYYDREFLLCYYEKL